MATTSDVPPLPPFYNVKPPPAETLAIKALARTLGSLYRVTVAETQRLFLGTFVCVDPQGNLVLDQTLEFELDDAGAVKGDPKGRDVGLVMIKREHWTRVERMPTDQERRRMWEQQAAEEGQRGCTPS